MNPARSRWLTIAALAAICPGIGGCAIVSWTVAQFAPPQKVEAVYKPPEDKKILVFVDDYLNPQDCGEVKRELTERLGKQLIEHGVAAKTVSFRRLVNLMAATPEFNELAVVQVGSRLGADIVLYVHVDNYTLKDSEVSPLWKGELEVSVRVVDVAARKRLWPLDRRKYPLKPVRLSPVQDPSPTYAAKISRQLAERMSDRIAKLFYDHTVDVRDTPKDDVDSSGWGM